MDNNHIISKNNKQSIFDDTSKHAIFHKSEIRMTKWNDENIVYSIFTKLEK